MVGTYVGRYLALNMFAAYRDHGTHNPAGTAGGQAGHKDLHGLRVSQRVYGGAC